MMRLLLFATLLAALVPTSAHAAVVITEIAAAAPADHEWIELYNSGPDGVDLTGYKFVENATNHGLTEHTGGLLLAAGGYAVIAQKADVFAADHPGVALVIDSAWSSLREDGEEIGLRDAAGVMLEQFTYPPGPDHPLARLDAARSGGEPGNWQEDPGGGSPGAANPLTAAAQDPAPTPEPAPSPEAVDQPAGVGSAYRAGDVVINEFLADPADGDEWVELYNRGGQLINLQGWWLEDGSGAKTKLSGSLNGFAWLLVAKPAGSLNNRGDRIVLRDLAGEVIDAVSYGDWQDGDVRDNAPAGGDGASVGRRSDGHDSGDDAADFATLPSPTPGEANRGPTQSPAAATASVRFSELYPNPPGADTDGEFIELTNQGDELAVLDGWQVVDASGVAHTLANVSLRPNAFLVLPRSASGLALDNTGAEALTLRRPDDSVADTVRYPAPAPEGLAYARGTDSRWSWTLSPTPGSPNTLTAANRAPVATVVVPAKAAIGELLVFDASDSTDPDRDALTFRWDFGDGRADTGPLVRQVYSAAGRYRVDLAVADGRGATSTAQAFITIVRPPNAEATPQPPTPAPAAVAATASQTTSQPPARQAAAPSAPRAAPKPNQRASVTGTVLVAPGVLGRQYFYLDDGSRGLQIYQYHADFPALAVGDIVRAVGTWSIATPTPRLKLARGSDLTVLAGHATPTPNIITAVSAGSAYAGRLVTASGVVTEAADDHLILDDSRGELVASLRAGTGLTASALAVGTAIRLTGILDVSSSGAKILPRSATDLVVAQVLGASTTATSTPPTAATPLVLGLAAAAVTSAGLGVWWRRRTTDSPLPPA